MPILDPNKYMHTNGCMYAFVEVDPKILGDKIPAGAKNSEKVLSQAVYDEQGAEIIPAGAKNSEKVLSQAVYDEQGAEITPAVKEQKSISEYVNLVVLSNKGDKALVLLSVKTHDYGRLYPCDEAELVGWDAGEYAIPIKEDKWLTLEEYRAKLAGPDYGGIEDVS